MSKTTVALVTFALWAGILHAECVLMRPREASRHVKIQVSLGGKPLEGAKVIFRPSHQCTCATDALRGNPLDTSMIPSSSSRMTDKNGIADLPELAPGDYDVAASINDVASTVFLGLRVSADLGPTTVPIDLTEPVHRVEDVPVHYRIETFRGTVKDFSGAVISGAKIAVVNRGSQAKDIVLRDKTDANGNFSVHLADGSYIAVFFSPGFRPAIEPFEVTKTGASELPVKLTPNSCP